MKKMSYNALRSGVLMLLLLIPGIVLAQSLTVNGKVIDNYGDPVIGATVVIIGATQKGTITDVDGNYTLQDVAKNATLKFSSIGLDSKEEPVRSRTTINVTLSENVQQLDQVVVTALGIKREMKTLGYSMSSIKGDDMLKAGTPANPLTALYGKSAGVGIQGSSSGPTGGINIKIRGANRLDNISSTRPLFVVDGVPIYDTETSMATRDYDPLNSFDFGTGINDINAEDIESMEILKGAKASILYGSAGANGVILITTKKGAGTRGLGVNVSFNQTWEEPVFFLDLQNEYGSGQNTYALDDNKNVIVSDHRSFGTKFDGREITYWDGSKRAYKPYKNNFTDMFSTGSTRSTNVSISGGNEKGNMRLSYTNYDFDGLMSNQWQRRNSFSFAGQMNASELAKIEVTANLYKIKTNNRMPNIHSLMSSGLNRDYDYQTIKERYKEEDGSFMQMDGLNLPAYQSNLAGLLWHQNENKNSDDKLHLIASAKGIFQVHPYVNIVTLAGIDHTQVDHTMNQKVTSYDPVKGGGYRFKTEQYGVYTLQGMVNFDKNFMSDRLRVFTTVGGEWRSTKEYDVEVKTYGDFTYPDWYSLNNAEAWPSASDKGKVRNLGRGVESIYSVLGSATVSFDEKYHLEFQARNDWASTLPKENNSYFYPGVSFTWNFNEDINIPKLQTSSLRLGWADAGRPAVRYFAQRAYNMGWVTGTDAQSIKAPRALFAGDLKPERKREFEIGMNTRWFDNHRLEFDFSYYTGTTYDQILPVPLTGVSGYDQIRLNAGKVKNYGFEVLLKGVFLQTSKLRWDATLTLANQFSKVQKLYPGITQNALYEAPGWLIVAKEGQKSGEIMAFDYRKDEQGKKIVGTDGLYSLDESEFKAVGNINPSLIGGFSTNLYYKGLNLNIGIDYSFGSKLVSMSNYYLLSTGASKETLAGRDESKGGLAYYIDDNNKKVAWDHNKVAPGDKRVYHDGIILPGVKDDGNGGYAPNDIITSAQSYWATFNQDMQQGLQPDYIYKNNYIKMREISLSYTLPQNISEKLRLQKVTFSLSGRNLFYIHKTIKNIDTEAVQGSNSYFEYSILPMYRSWGMGVNISF